MPFTLDPLSEGEYVVGGSVSGGAQPVGFDVKTSTMPWGLFAVVLLLLQAVLIFLRNRLRTRLARKDTAAATGPSGAPAVVAPMPTGPEALPK
jgi:hypothetical protein